MSTFNSTSRKSQQSGSVSGSRDRSRSPLNRRRSKRSTSPNIHRLRSRQQTRPLKDECGYIVSNSRSRSGSKRSQKDKQSTTIFNSQTQEVSTTPSSSHMKCDDFEKDEEVLMRRQKNIDYFKVTDEYQRYAELYPRHKRQRKDPSTPDKFSKFSRRAWDGSIKAWKLRVYRLLEKLDAEHHADVHVDESKT